MPTNSVTGAFTSIPQYLHISGAHTSDVSVLDHLPLQAGAIYVMDRGYIHFKRLYALAQAAVLFVVRARANMRFRRRYSHPVDKACGLRSDQTIVLTGRDSWRDYPAPARGVHFFDQEHQNDLIFLTNHFALPALGIAQLYKQRWKIGVSRKGHMVQSVRDRPRLKDSGLVGGEGSWRESKATEPSDNMLGKECARRIRLQRTVNVEVASLHGFSVAETVDNCGGGFIERRSLIRRIASGVCSCMSRNSRPSKRPTA
jgi:hypothetical protein